MVIQIVKRNQFIIYFSKVLKGPINLYNLELLLIILFENSSWIYLGFSMSYFLVNITNIDNSIFRHLLKSMEIMTNGLEYMVLKHNIILFFFNTNFFMINCMNNFTKPHQIIYIMHLNLLVIPKHPTWIFPQNVLIY